MKFLALLYIFLLTFQTKAIEVSFYTEKSKDNIYQDVTKVTCSINESNLCQYMCGDKKVCYRPELKCTNCAGSTDQFLRAIFTKTEFNFSVTQQKWQSGYLISYLADKYYILLSYRSIYNFHKIWGSEEVAKSFQSFCPQYAQEQNEEPLFIVQLDDSDRPHQLKAVICKDENHQSYALTIESKLDPKGESQKLSTIINQNQNGE